MAQKKIKTGQLADRTSIPAYLTAALPAIAAAVYFFSNPKPQNYYDYTFRVAENFLRGSIAFTERQPSWLNEFVPFEGYYYSVFPLGSVLSMIPFALLKTAGFVQEMPGALIAAIHAGAICLFLLKIASHYEHSRARKLVLTAAVLFGTFMWTNLTFGGAWQLALGFAMVGELGAIYFTVYNRKPLLAGLFFAIAFGNRTEILLTAPIFLFLLLRPLGNKDDSRVRFRIAKDQLVRTAFFCLVPFLLGVATLAYNYVRFHSFTDFGYARIPGVLNEPWYHAGIFSWSYLPRQAWEMLFKSWERWPAFPYLGPSGFSSTIIWSSPFLLFVLRSGSPGWFKKWYRRVRKSLRGRFPFLPFPAIYSIFTIRTLPTDRPLKWASWAAIAILTVLLWTHGNSGGWQFGYRYAMVLLPWAFVLMLESAPRRISLVEGTAIGFSFAANAYATWLYHWTTYMKP